MKKIKQKPKIDFTRNRLLRKVFKEYDITFSLTLDTCDYIDKKDLIIFKRHVRKDMKRNLRKVPSISRRLINLAKREFYAKLLEKADKYKKFIKCVSNCDCFIKSLTKHKKGNMKEYYHSCFALIL